MNFTIFEDRITHQMVLRGGGRKLAQARLSQSRSVWELVSDFVSFLPRQEKNQVYLVKDRWQVRQLLQHVANNQAVIQRRRKKVA